MKCPFCGTLDSQVIDSRLNDEGDSIRRRRKCAACNKRFTTYEAVELRMPQVVKQNGKREDYSREKVQTSFMRALHKRPVSAELLMRQSNASGKNYWAWASAKSTRAGSAKWSWTNCANWTKWPMYVLHRCIALSKMSTIFAMSFAICKLGFDLARK